MDGMDDSRTNHGRVGDRERTAPLVALTVKPAGDTDEQLQNGLAIRRCCTRLAEPCGNRFRLLGLYRGET